MKLRSVVLGEVANRQTDRQTGKRRAKHYLHGKDEKNLAPS